MITGDKLETAENIGLSCCLFDSQTKLFKINSRENIDLVFDNMERFTKILNNNS